jgi:hypothetical protein
MCRRVANPSSRISWRSVVFTRRSCRSAVPFYRAAVHLPAGCERTSPRCSFRALLIESMPLVSHERRLTLAMSRGAHATAEAPSTPSQG